jgi:hypothetical protein
MLYFDIQLRILNPIVAQDDIVVNHLQFYSCAITPINATYSTITWYDFGEGMNYEDVQPYDTTPNFDNQYIQPSPCWVNHCSPFFSRRLPTYCSGVLDITKYETVYFSLDDARQVDLSMFNLMFVGFVVAGSFAGIMILTGAVAWTFDPPCR